MSEANQLAGRVALVTGSSSGIGSAIAKLFAAEGANVVVHGRDEVAVDRVSEEINTKGGRALAVLGDVTCAHDIEAMRQRIESQWRPVDILIANAGANLTPPAPLEDIPEQGWRATLHANLTATFLTLKTFLPGMKERRSGAIITIASAAARRANAMTPIAYAAAKAGIIMLTQHVAAQAGPFGVRINCVAPETILTEKNLSRIPLDQQEALASQRPIRRLGLPYDVAQAALYLASEQSAYVTGMVIDVAGGAVIV